jgi:hypothetical protein
MWKELLCNKYLKNKTLSEVQVKPTNSPFWKGILLQRETFFQRGCFAVGNGESTRFWEDVWLGDTPLAVQYPNLYSIASYKNVRVSSVLGGATLNISFRRNIIGDRWTTWLNLVEKLMEIELSDEKDSFRWNLTESGLFSVKSLYTDIMHGHTKFLSKYLWKLKVPLKIRIFMWFLNKKVILTKDNLAKRKWTGCKKNVRFATLRRL